MGKKMRNIIPELISILLMLLFVYASVSKLRDYEAFRTQLGQSPLLTSYAGMIAWFIPTVELLITAMLFFDRTRLLALFASYTIMVVFSAYIIAITHFADYIPCSCGGVLQEMSWSQHLIFNLGFVLLSLVAILLHNEKALNSFLQKSGEAENLSIE